MASTEMLIASLHRIVSLYEDACDVMTIKINTYHQSSFKIIESFGCIKDLFQIICDHIENILEKENQSHFESFDPRGTWGVVTRILTKLVHDTQESVLAFPEIKPQEKSYYFSFKRKEQFILQKLNELNERIEYASKCLIRLILSTLYGNLFDESNIKEFLESSYSYPFWYTFDPDNKKLRDNYDVLINAVTNSYNKESYLWRTLSQSALSVRALFKNADKLSKSNHADAKLNASLMLVRQIWNFSEAGLPRLVISFLKPKIKTKRILVFNGSNNDGAEFRSIRNLEVFLLYDDRLPFTIPDGMRKKVKTLKEDLLTNEALKDVNAKETETSINNDDRPNEPFNLYSEFEGVISESNISNPNALDEPLVNSTNNYVLIHFHGGGWVAGSPSSHEVYLREWATLTKAYVFSVDYSKSPESKYPQALNECYHVYKKIAEGEMIDLIPSKIVIAGDSAGGNLALAVTLKAIANNIRIPDGLLLAYPPLDLTKVSTPSRVFFANDVVLPYYFLEVCLNSYLRESDDSKNDYLISPLNAPHELLTKLPDNIVFMSAGYDPLLDDTTRFIQKLDKLGKKYKHFVFDLPHAFWSLGEMHPKAKRVVTHTGNILNSIFNDRKVL